MLEEVRAWVVVGLVRTIAGSLRLSESSGKTSLTVSHSFLNSIRLSLWSAWKEKDSGGGDFVVREGED